MADAPPAEETPPEGEEVVAAEPEIPPCKNYTNDSIRDISSQYFSFQCSNPGADLTDCQIKIDHFDKIHALSEEGKIDGAPNYRQVINYLQIN